MDFSFHRLAAKDYLDARRWYARRSVSATNRFANAVDASLQATLADPYRWPKEDDRVRSILVKRFPYVLYFEIVDDAAVLLLAVAHTSRRPGHWKRRVKRR